MIGGGQRTWGEDWLETSMVNEKEKKKKKNHKKKMETVKECTTTRVSGECQEKIRVKCT